MIRRFEFAQNNASKFWEIDLSGSSHTVRYGRIGTGGQSKTKTFDDDEAAKKSANKLIGQKTKKGYEEVPGAASSGGPSTPTSVEPTKQKEPTAKKKASPKKTPSKGKSSSAKLPDLVLSSKKYGSRKLTNFVAKLVPLGTDTKLPHDFHKLTSGFGYDLPAVLTHLLANSAIEPAGCVARLFFEKVDPAKLPAERTIAFLTKLDAAMSHGRGLALRWVNAANLEAPDALYAAYTELAPRPQGAVALVRFAAGHALSVHEKEAAIGALLAPLSNTTPAEMPFEGVVKPLTEVELLSQLEAIGGEVWFSLTPMQNRPRLPWSILGKATAGQSLDEVNYLIGRGMDELLFAARSESATGFFEAAELAQAEQSPRGVTALRLAGMARATSPDEIPDGIELECGAWQFRVLGEIGCRALSALGEERLDRFVDRADEVGLDAIRNMWMSGLELGPSALELALSPGPFNHATEAERWGESLRWPRLSEGCVSDRLRRVMDAAATAEGHPAVALRRWVASLIAEFPEGEEVPLEADAFLEPAALPHFSYFNATAKALWRLPATRAEKILVESADEFARPRDDDNESMRPHRELGFFRPNLSDSYAARAAGLILEHQTDAEMWDNMNHARRGFRLDAIRLAEQLAAQLEGSPSADLVKNVSEGCSPEAAERLQQLAGKSESPREELRRVCAEIEGPRTPVYLLFPTGESATENDLIYTGGRPGGVAADATPRLPSKKRKGPKLVHAFTVDLEAVPELAARHRESRALSIYIQRYSEEEVRAQALITHTQAEIDAEPAALEGARRVEFERLEVPTAIFEEEPEQAVQHLRSLVYQQAGFLLGGPLWLQDGPHGPDSRFVAQFDERIVDANLGDGGIAYSFTDECTWQCH